MHSSASIVLLPLASAQSWSTNVGHPGSANPAIGEVFNTYVIPQMFAMAARRDATAEDSVRWAEGRAEAIFRSWRNRGKI
jgi:multiple sugar transport system substrate-binding protein